jgi:diadenosine tetraphosphate (Ap4A) HIT family hydrolase
MTRRTPPTAQEWYDETRARIAATGYRPAQWTDWPTWPFDGDISQRDLERPVAERPRGGEGGVDCFICEAAADPDSDYVVWRDDVAMLGEPRDAFSLPFLAFLMPRRHADLSDLGPRESARMGELMPLLERAVTEVLDVPRVQLVRYGDGQEHLHWWVMARPTGQDQLRGTFLPLWDDLLPARPREESRADLVAVARRLSVLAGGEVREEARRERA